MPAVLIAQFISAMADNVLLFLMLGLLKAQAFPEWSNPLLQQFFLIAYIVLAPFVGTVADGFAKGRVMLVSNVLKFLAVLLLLTGLSPFICYALVGVGACLYSPAKYGILKEIKGEDFLVKANAMMEGSTIAAILIGVVVGGLLADYATANDSFMLSAGLVSAMYLIATVLCIYIPKLAAKHPIHEWSLSTQVAEFKASFRTLFKDIDARVTLLGTGLFWGIGATMRFLLIAWVPAALQITDNKTPAILNAVVAIGIVVGSGAASMIPLQKALKVIFSGVLMGLMVVVLSLQQDMKMVYLCLIAIGALGGLFVVPMNAVLQQKGHQLVGGGHAVAIQNFIENIMMLLMLGLYFLASAIGIPTIPVVIGFGVLIMGLMAMLLVYKRRIVVP